MTCTIFSDSLSALQTLGSDCNSAVCQEINYCLFQLYSQGVPVTLCWIPTHVGIQGNEMADKLAKLALDHEKVDFKIKPSLSEVFSQLEAKIMEEWQILWDKSNNGRFFYNIQKKVSTRVQFSDMNRAKENAITRLRFGKCLLAGVLHMIGKSDTDMCEICDEPEDVNHYLQKCKRYENWLVELNDKVIEEGGNPTVHTLLGKQRWHNDVWNYVLNTQRDL